MEALAQSFLDNLFFVQGRSTERATVNDLYMALAHTVRDRLVERWIQTVKNYQAQDVRVVCYLSAEFLTGPHLANNLINLGIYDETEQAMRQLGIDLNTLIEQEEEPGLGNGGLGRLASCFMDSLATLDIPAIGYGIRYEYGIFDQQIRDGWQVESTDKWLRLGNPWALERPEDAFEVKMGGRTEKHTDAKGQGARGVDSAEAGARGSARYADSGLPDQHREHHAAVGGAGGGELRLRDLQPGGFSGRGGRQGLQREYLQDSLSQRRRRPGQAVAAGAAVLLCLVQLAAHSEDSGLRSTVRWPSCTATSPSR